MSWTWKIKKAFEAGYDEVKKLPEERLFLWMGKFVYGVLYNDLVLRNKPFQKRPNAKEFKLSPYLKQRFAKFHLMLQSLVVPMEFKGVKPWSIEIVKLKYSKDIFNYKDEPTNLNFSLGMNGFGIVACLQDNGAVANQEKDILAKISEQKHCILFSLKNLSGRFLYANYLLKEPAQKYNQVEEDQVIIESYCRR